MRGEGELARISDKGERHRAGEPARCPDDVELRGTVDDRIRELIYGFDQEASGFVLGTCEV